MTPGGLVARIFPSAAAAQEELGRRARAGGVLSPPVFTFESLLPRLLEQVAAPGRAPLSDLAGPLILRRLLADSPGEAGLYAGLAAGRRLPDRLWRLLTEVKAAGLDADGLGRVGEQGRPRVAALARLLARYQAELARLGLADQADLLAVLERELAGGRLPPLARGWQGVEARGVMWLRPLDLRLLKALARRLPVRVGFCFAPSREGAREGLGRLVATTADALESEDNSRLEVFWDDLDSAPGPLAGLAAGLLDPGREAPAQERGEVELVREAGRYGLAEALVVRALELVDRGVPPQDMVMVFPELEAYGPMVADAARRLGLPLSLADPAPLTSAPWVQAVAGLLELPLAGWPRHGLAAAWDSPYTGPALARACLGPEAAPPKRAGALLAEAGYVDEASTPLETRLPSAARRFPRRAGEFQSLGLACAKIKAKLAIFAQSSDLIDYCSKVISLMAELAPGGLAETTAAGPPPEALAARDLSAWAGLAGAVRSLALAAEQTGGEERLAPGRLLALVKEVAARAPWPRGREPAAGVRVMALGDTLGLSAPVVLAGGLSQGEFPRRPAGQRLLSSEDRLALGRAARQPVWRTDPEEYEGQVARLAWLVKDADLAVMGAAAADGAGREQEPALVLERAARLVGRELPRPRGGVFGGLPALEDCREPFALWGRLARDLLRPGPEPPLARAALWAWAQGPGRARRWSSVAGRAAVESRRAELDLLPGERRAERADAFTGRLGAEGALARLAQALAPAEARRLSPSALEAYAGCPQAWFFQYVLGVRPPEPPTWELTAAGEGQWVHQTLALFFAPGEYDPSWDREAVARRLEDCLDRARQELAGQGGHPAVWEARRPMLAKALARVAANEMEAMHPARPLAVEQAFGREDGLAVEVDQGPPLVLSGRLDRLDQGPEGLCVTDYKHSTDTQKLKQGADLELAGRQSFQLPVYLAFAAARWGQGRVRGRLVSTRLTREKAHVLEPQPEFLSPAPDPEGEPTLFQLVAALWRRIGRGEFFALPEPASCRFCRLSALCRARPAALAGEPE